MKIQVQTDYSCVKREENSVVHSVCWILPGSALTQICGACVHVFHAVVLFFFKLWVSEQASRATHTDTPAWEARVAWQAGSVHQSGRPFMRLHESTRNNDKHLIIGNQADLLQNLTP